MDKGVGEVCEVGTVQMTDLKMPANSIVLVFPTPWDDDAGDRIRESHFDIYGSHLDPTLEFYKDDPLDDLVEAARGAQPPFAETELLALDAQITSWRYAVETNGTQELDLIRKVAICFTACGALAMFVPSTMCLLAPSFVKLAASNPEPNSATQLFVHARRTEVSMITRGLTAFALPEIEISTNSGLNAAFFDLMDVATEMIASNCAFKDGDSLTIGPANFIVREVAPTPDDASPIAGTFGQIRVERS